jgi:hypothetical protein
MYNLVKRQAEVELLPLALSEGLGVIPYSPLGGGLLTGKYAPGQRPEKGRLVENAMYQVRYGGEGIYETADRFVSSAAACYEPALLRWPGWAPPGRTAQSLSAGSWKARSTVMCPTARRGLPLSPDAPLADRSEESSPAAQH